MHSPSLPPSSDPASDPLPPPPGGYPPYMTGAPAPEQWVYAPIPTDRGRAPAVVGVVLGFVGLLFGFLVLPVACALAAVILGHVAFATIRRSDPYRQGEPIAIAAFAVGYAGLLFWGLYLSWALGR